MNTVTMADLRRILVDCAGEGEPAGDISDIAFTELGYDSLALIETAARLKQEFGVTITDDQVTELATPAALLAAVNAVHRTHHAVVVPAPADAVYAILADVTPAPALFAAPVHYRHIERAEHRERFRIWVLAAGEVANWTSVRRLDPVRRVIEFEQEQPHPLVLRMRGEFRVLERDGHAEVLLDHEFVATDDAAAAVVEQATEANSTAQLATLRGLAALPLADLLCTVTDSVDVRGTAADAYEFVRDAGRWPDRLPHIGSVRVREAGDGVQHLTKEVDGHVTTSVRLCFPHDRIAFKQTTPPGHLLGNAGQWTFTPTATGCTVAVRHTVLLHPDAPAGTRAAIAATGRLTLLGAKDFAEHRASA